MQTLNNWYFFMLLLQYKKYVSVAFVLYIFFFREAAISELHQLLNMCRGKDLVYLEVKILCNLGRILIYSCPTSPTKALSYVLQGLAICEDNEGLESLSAEANVLLAIIHFYMGAPSAALDKLQVQLFFFNEFE
jgi:hypothetical protein